MAWHVLVVEEVAALRQGLAHQLESEGFEATGVQSGQSALEFIEQEGLPHLAVIDLTLPDVHGLDLGRQFADRGAPIIVTGADSAQVAIQALTLAEDYVRKPFDAEEMAYRIRRVLSRIADFS